MKTRIISMAAGTLFCAAAWTTNLNAQAYKLHQVIVLNDGTRLYNDSTGTYVTVGSYNPVTKVYRDFDTIKGAKFGSDVIIDSGYIYVGADSLLIKYDLNTKAKIATQTVVGIREMAIWGNQILVTCGATFPLTSYFQAYDKNTLHLIYRDTTVSNAAQGIKVLNDSAYIAINGFWGTAQNLGVIDLKGQKEKHEVNLGANGLNPYEVEVQPSSQMIYTVNNLNYSNSTITQYNTPSVTFTSTSLNLSSSCTGSTYYVGIIYFQAGNSSNIGLYSTISHTVFDSLKIGQHIYGMGIDSADGYIYVGQTDYFSYGKVFIYDLFANPIDSFGVDVGPGSFAFDVRKTTGIPALTNSLSVNVYPNPTSSMVNITIGGNASLQKLSLMDALGKTVYEEPVNASQKSIALNMENYSTGIYFLTIQAADGSVIHKKIVKE